MFEHKRDPEKPFLQANEKPIDFVMKNARTKHSDQRFGLLWECCHCCAVLNRGATGNTRNYLDGFIVDVFNSMSWPKDKPIQLVDTSAGGLIQTATIATSLVNAGYKLELTIIDSAYQNWAQADEVLKTQKEIHFYHTETKAKVDAARWIIAEFQKFLAILNDKVGKKDAAVLQGVFSHVDSYLATLKGESPLEYELIKQEELEAKLASGTKRRYLNWHVRPADVEDVNDSYFFEFKQADAYRGKGPDLVITIDDISEFLPIGLKALSTNRVNDTEERNDEISLYSMGPHNDFAYQNEIVEPLTKLNSNAVFIGTKKIFKDFEMTNDAIEIQIESRAGKNSLIHHLKVGVNKQEAEAVLEGLAKESKHSLDR